jgi:hypothetical protein
VFDRLRDRPDREGRRDEDREVEPERRPQRRADPLGEGAGEKRAEREATELAKVEARVAWDSLPSPAKSTRVAVPVPVKMPIERPERIRPRKSGARPWARRKTTALAAERASPGSNVRRRPIWSEMRPKSRRPPITPTA